MVSLRPYVYWSGSAMLDCPVQYHTSPNKTSSMAALPEQPSLHVAVMVAGAPPAGDGGSSAFHVPAASSTLAGTVYAAPPRAATVTVTLAPRHRELQVAQVTSYELKVKS